MSSTRPQTSNGKQTLESAISAALEQQQIPAIPVDFASRVTARAATIPIRKHAPRAHYARSITILLIAGLMIAAFALAPHAEASFASLSFDAELSAIALVAALVYWLAQAPKRSL